MSIIVPVASTKDEGAAKALHLNNRIRTYPALRDSLAPVPVPKVYVFNIYDRAWPNRPAGCYNFTIPACKPGQDYSDPLVIDGLVLSEYDLGDGTRGMGTTVDPGTRAAEDIVGIHSTAAALDLFTTNLEWYGVFVSQNAVPTVAELETAREKLSAMMQLIYAKGAELVQAGEKVPMMDRKNYNDAAEFLGRTALWGNQEHVLDRCIFCKEPVQAGALKCKHCGSRLDSTEAKKLRGEATE